MTRDEAFALIRAIKADLGGTIDQFSVVALSRDETYVVSVVEKRSGKESIFESETQYRRMTGIALGKPKLHVPVAPNRPS